MHLRKIPIIAIAILVYTSIAFALIYTSPNYTLEEAKVAASGGKACSVNYDLDNTKAGSIFGGKAEGVTYSLDMYPTEEEEGIPPNSPIVNPVVGLTNNPTQAITGTKDAYASVHINGYKVVPLTAETIWYCDVALAEGINTLIITSKNAHGGESDSVTLNVTLDTIPPDITITSPENGRQIDTAPITVLGAIGEPCDVTVNAVLATVDDTTFTAEGVDLQYGENTITATAYDLAGNFSQDTITVTSTVSSDCDIIKVTPDVYECDPTEIIAGSQIPLTIRFEIDDTAAENEPIVFRVTQGNGSIAQSPVSTNVNGEATATLNTDTDALVTNLVEAFSQNFPDKKIIFHIDTKEGPPASLIKLTDDTVTPVPGAGIELAIRLVDSNNNPVQGENVIFQITSGSGVLSANNANTNEYGIAEVVLTTTTQPGLLSIIQAQLTSESTITATFSIATSGNLTVTPDDVIARVIANDELIHDAMADITVTSNAPWAPSVAHLKIWQKGDKQKVQEISPEPGVHIRPLIDLGIPSTMTRSILSYDSITGVYAIKSIQKDQEEDHPYQIDYVDYNKGVITKTENYAKDGDYLCYFIIEYSNFVNINGIWGFTTMTERTYDEFGNQLYETISSYSNIQLNIGIDDSEFEE